MALNLFNKYGSRANPPSIDYPQGSIKNRSAPDVKDGTPLDADWANDHQGFFQSILSYFGVTANGAPDKVGASQYFDALMSDPTEARRGMPLKATNAEVQAGTNANKMVTPAALASRTATESRTGLLEIATQAEVDAGTDDARAVTPKKLRAGFSIVKSGNFIGISFPSWLGGLIINAGRTAVAANDDPATTTLPISYTESHVAAVACVNYTDPILTGMIGATASPISLSTIRVMADSSDVVIGSTEITWISIGY